MSMLLTVTPIGRAEAIHIIFRKSLDLLNLFFFKMALSLCQKSLSKHSTPWIIGHKSNDSIPFRLILIFLFFDGEVHKS
ncbi:MAG: hypothetical protein A3F84_26340 [Candidatus Handelsmanbacteria bacterium RIFCSPLOWO2_12_FULL_64_10]|uniref:Uncharacterized protein n=1 Tax=Handelsmanbacteria sp. (strain RIFCSPLOWO2_12_FULL_64_10) TaxID=1817868 RepID=A0A1F6CA05_HANXR|nr:MAG: hypothetical protein A3F84_26340 [Candidatus Handelsmanbacteria bacterium RIFCSPLOWO2_12_FULL_64_10]